MTETGDRNNFPHGHKETQKVGNKKSVWEKWRTIDLENRAAAKAKEPIGKPSKVNKSSKKTKGGACARRGQGLGPSSKDTEGSGSRSILGQTQGGLTGPSGLNEPKEG